MKKERKLDKVYEEFEAKYKNMSEEDMKKTIETLEKEINGKTESLERADGEQKENLEKNVGQLKKKLDNLKGYSKYKNQIESIRKYKGKLIEKLNKEIINENESKKLLDEAKKHYEEVDKKLSNEQYTMGLTNEEYNTLLIEKSDAKKQVEMQTEIFEKSKNKILDLNSKISKCDLAWKTLFTNKDWDEIQKRAMEPDRKLTRKIDNERDVSINQKRKQNREKEKTITDEDLRRAGYDARKEKKELGKKVTEILDKKENTALVEQKEKKSFWEKLKAPFVRAWKWLTMNDDDNKVQEEVQQTNNNETRDQFLEGLRKHVDTEYKEAVIKAKNEEFRKKDEQNKKEYNNRSNKKDGEAR